MHLLRSEQCEQTIKCKCSELTLWKTGIWAKEFVFIFFLNDRHSIFSCTPVLIPPGKVFLTNVDK
jgi:hypothetical protein